eukprot:Tamp_00866.p1 GENE.Tamp_00866~~Tamp_00866.p1  ORF type:complete len:830 (-),score=147.67 Tamp_00866:4030-6471(-)
MQRAGSTLSRTGSGLSRTDSMFQRTSSAAAHFQAAAAAKAAAEAEPTVEELRGGVKKNKQPVLSMKLRVTCGPVLKSFLHRHGVKLDEEIDPGHRAKLRTVFELFDHNEEGRIDARHLGAACEMLGVLEKDRLSAHKHQLDFREFALEMTHCGFGSRDVLAELYHPETRRKLEERRKMQRSVPARDPELVLLREKRDRAVKNIFLEHIQRKKEIFGHITQEDEEEVLGLFRASPAGDSKGGSGKPSSANASSPGAVQRQSTHAHVHSPLSPSQHHQTSHAHHHSPRSHHAPRFGSQRMHWSHKSFHHEENQRHIQMQDSQKRIGTDREVQSFSVMVIEARNLLLPPAPAYITNRRPPDTWITCEYGDAKERTFPNKATLTPQWNSTLKFNVQDRNDGLDFLHGPPLIVNLMSSDPTDPTQDGPVVMGSVTVYPEDIVSSDEIGDGWWKLVPPDKKAQPNFKVEVYFMFKAHLRPKVKAVLPVLSRDLSRQDLFSRAESVTDVEADNQARMDRLLQWEKGRTRVESASAAAFLARAMEARNLYVPPGNSLFSLCQRCMPVSLKATDVLQKLRTPFARHFKAESLEPSGAKGQAQARLKSAISSAMSLKFIQKMSIMATHHRNEEFQRIVVSHGTCLAVDAHFTVSIWGNSKSRLLQLAEEDIDMKSLPDRIKIEYRTRIEKETAGLGAQEAALVTRKLEDEKEMHLNDLPSYISTKRGQPSVLKVARDLSVFDLACSDEHAVFLTRDGQVYTWGLGLSGKLGHGGLTDEPLPQIVDTLSKRRCIQVKAGINIHSRCEETPRSGKRGSTIRYRIY